MSEIIETTTTTNNKNKNPMKNKSANSTAVSNCISVIKQEGEKVEAAGKNTGNQALKEKGARLQQLAGIAKKISGSIGSAVNATRRATVKAAQNLGTAIKTGVSSLVTRKNKAATNAAAVVQSSTAPPEQKKKMMNYLRNFKSASGQRLASSWQTMKNFAGKLKLSNETRKKLKEPFEKMGTAVKGVSAAASGKIMGAAKTIKAAINKKVNNIKRQSEIKAALYSLTRPQLQTLMESVGARERQAIKQSLNTVKQNNNNNNSNFLSRIQVN